MLNTRQSKILDILINEFINTAMPVSSGTVFDIGGLDVSCPTIRNEMADLTERGYLAQPHISAGRVPTERGYRFFVDEIMQETKRRRKRRLDEAESINDIAEKISRICSDLILFSESEGSLRHIGLRKVLNNPEFENRDAVVSFIDEVENLNMSLAYDIEDDVNIFIGSENPFFKRNKYSMIISRVGDGFISIVGPTRMNYRRNLNLL